MPTKEIPTHDDSMIQPPVVKNGIDDSLTRTPDHEFTEAEAEQIAAIAERRGWNIAVHDYMKSVNHRAYRLAIDEYRSQIRFLLPSSFDARVLNLRSDWGAVAFNLAVHASFVVAMDDRPTRPRFISARKAQTGTQTLYPLCGSLVPHLPFTDETFDVVIILDALEHLSALNGWSWKTAQSLALAEAMRVLKKGGCALVGVPNRLGFGRPRTSGVQRFRTYWGYRRALQKAGFSEIQSYASLPSNREPFFILPLNRPHALNFFARKMFTAQDYRSKLEARGLGAVYRLALMLQRFGQRLHLMRFARYFVPAYLILARK